MKQQLNLFISLFIAWICIQVNALFIDRWETLPLLFTIFLGSIALWWGIYKTTVTFSVYHFIGLIIAFRFSLLFIGPNLSDDCFRFFWDGWLLKSGINPYMHTPKELIAEASNPYLRELFNNLNSQNYFAVYPPAAQYLYGFVSFLGGDDIQHNIAWLRLFTLVFEVGFSVVLFHLLHHFKIRTKWGLAFMLSPFFVLESFVNLHIEGVVIFFIAVAILFIIKKVYLISSPAMAMAILVKLHAAYFFPFIGLFAKKKNLFVYSLISLSVIGLFSAPIITTAGLANIYSSLQLFSKTFEFNASIYYLLRQVGYVIVGYNTIAFTGPFLQSVTLLFTFILFWKSWKSDREKSLRFGLAGYCIYFLLATTVHPWYFILPAFLGITQGYLFPLVFGTLAMLSYSAYGAFSVDENYWIIAIEYILGLAFCWWEFHNPIIFKPEMQNLA